MAGQMTPAQWDAYLVKRYGLNQAGIENIAARLLWCEIRADPSEDDVTWEDADQQTRNWYCNRVREVLDEYIAQLDLRKSGNT